MTQDASVLIGHLDVLFCANASASLLPIFKTGIFIFFLLIYKSSLYILDMSYFSLMYCKIFSQPVLFRKILPIPGYFSRRFIFFTLVYDSSQINICVWYEVGSFPSFPYRHPIQLMPFTKNTNFPH